MIWWTGLAPWEFESPFPGSLISTFRILRRGRDRAGAVAGSLPARTALRQDAGARRPGRKTHETQETRDLNLSCCPEHETLTMKPQSRIPDPRSQIPDPGSLKSDPEVRNPKPEDRGPGREIQTPEPGTQRMKNET
jgi:hypothetical protein